MLDGVPAAGLARRWGVPQCGLFRRLTSTLDAIHDLGSQGAPDGARSAESLDKVLDIPRTTAHPEPETDFTFLAIAQIKRDLHRGAWIQSRADFAGCRDG